MTFPSVIWILHLLFWWPFLLRGQLQRQKGEGAHLGNVTHRHPRAVAMVGAHALAVGLSYAGVSIGLYARPVAPLDAPRIAAALFCIAPSLFLARWTLATFRSWRLRAELTEDHQLSTDGPFAYLRHPIYTAMDLLYLGTVAWVPNAWTAAGFLLGVLVGELRARAEEGLLLERFGDEYRRYAAKVKRRLPGVY